MAAKPAPNGMNTLANLLAAEKPVLRGPSCTMKPILEKLDEADRLALQDALNSDPDSGGWTSAAIRRALVGYGIAVGDTPVRRHRKKDCGCFKALT